MIDYKKVLEINKYLIENKATIEEICNKFNISRRTAQAYCGKYLNEYVEQSNDPEIKKLQEQVKIVKKNNEYATQFENAGISLQEIINYIIDYNTTIEYASLKFGISESIIKKYITNLKRENSDLYQKYIFNKEKRTKLFNSVGGKTGKRESKYSEFEALEIAETMISSSLTLKEASEIFQIPTSTIYEMLNKIDDDQLQKELEELYQYNKSTAPKKIWQNKKKYYNKLPSGG